MPDLERLLSKVHVGTCKLADFLVLLDTLDVVAATLAKVQPFLAELTSPRCVNVFVVFFGFALS